MTSLRSSLPTTFRFTAGKSTTRQLIDHMDNHFVPQLSNIDWEGEKLTPPQAVPWYPERLAWQVDVRKTVLRKQEQFKHFQKFLVHETEVGSISRQEAVSMIPPIFLDVRPEHLVLDMCAAPGSKTAQLIEALHSPMTSSPDNYDPCPQGLIVANDSDQKRAHMLVHQAARLPSPNIVVTNVDASALPKIQVPWKDDKDDSSIQAKDLKFDRILADVPCSGDGTIRKNIAIWKDWNMNNGLGLHALQLRILLRGLNALRPGGRLVYSTCSLNPIENEAVIAAALRECGADPAEGRAGSVRVVDVSDQFPELIRRPGMTTWKVVPGHGRHLFAGSTNNLQPKQAARNEAGKSVSGPLEGGSAGETAEIGAQEQTKAEEVANEPTAGSAEYRAKLPAIPFVDSWERLNELDKALAARTAKSLWPKGDEKALGIENCMRVYPQLQNTGGFFITVLEKSGDREQESQCAGMIRAVEALDAGASEPKYVGQAQKKRNRSPGSPTPESNGNASTKKQKAEDEETAVFTPVDESEETPAAPTTHVKPDNHARDRAAKQAAKHANDSGYGLPGGTPFRENPYCFIQQGNNEVGSIAKFFGLSSQFPLGNLLVRNEDGLPLRTIYLSSSSARALLSGGGPGIGSHPTMNPLRLRILNAGVKVFARQDSNKAGELECKWRLIADGLGPIRPFLALENTLTATLGEMSFLLSHYYPFFEAIPAGKFKDQVMAKKSGSYVLAVQPSTHNGSELKDTIYVPLWKAATSINMMLDKTERSAISLRLFGEDLSSPAKVQADELTLRRQQEAAVAAAAATETAVDSSATKVEQAAAQVTEEQGLGAEAVDEEIKSEEQTAADAVNVQ